MADSDSSSPFMQVKVQGIDVTANVTSAEVEDNDRLIDRARVMLDDAHGALTDIVHEGQTLTVDLGWTSEHAILFEGNVVRTIAHAQGGGSQRITITALDPSYKMMQGAPQTRDHTGALSAIIQNVVSPYGITIGQIQPDPDPQFTADRPLRQMNKKDWEFIQDLAVDYGGRAYVEYNDGASQFYFQPESQLLQGDSMGTLTYGRGASKLIEFRFQRIASGAVAQRTAITTDPSTGDPVTPLAAAPSLPDPPLSPDPTTSAELAQVSSGLAQDYESGMDAAATATSTPSDQRPQAVVAGAPSDPTVPDRVGRQDPTRVLGLLGAGTVVGTINLRAKGKVTIQGVAAWAAGDWYVHRATHVFDRSADGESGHRGYRTTFIVTR